MESIKVTEIADFLGLTHSAVSHWFSQRNRPGIKSIELMDKHFNIPPTAWYDIKSYVENNSERFETITRRQRKDNGNIKV